LFGRFPVKIPGADVRAGSLLAVAAFPMALALGLAAGGTPQQGVITAIAASALIAVLGSKSVYIAGPTVIGAIIASNLIQRFGAGGLVLCTVISGTALVALGWTRLGKALAFIPSSYYSGIASAAAVILVIGQLPNLLGLSRNITIGNAFDFGIISSSLGDVNWAAVGIALLSIGSIAACRSLRSKAIAAVVALVTATAAAQLGGLGVETVSSRFGPQGFHITGLAVPALPIERVQEILPTALALALLFGVESLIAGHIPSTNYRERNDTNTDLIQQGAVNIIGPLLGCLPAGVTLSNTVDNIKCGGWTPVGGLTYSLLTLVLLIVGGRFIGLVPICALAGVLVVAAYKLFAWHSFYDLRRMGRWDALLLTVTFGTGITISLSAAALVGVVVAAVALGKQHGQSLDAGGVDLTIRRCDDSQVVAIHATHPQLADLPTGVQVVELTDELCYSLAMERRNLRATKGALPYVMILRMGVVAEINGTGRCALWEFHEACQSRGIRLILSELHSRPMATLRTWRNADPFGKENICATFEEALVRARIVAGAFKIKTFES
jgi:SulP family sulfate permease